MRFSKMQACGNDYVYVFSDAKDDALASFAVFASDRHTGIGDDGVIALSDTDGYDARMRIFNRDGSQGATCGNGVRCAAEFLRKNFGLNKDTFKILTASGCVSVTLSDNGNSVIATAKYDKPRIFLNSDKIIEIYFEYGIRLNKNDVFAVNTGNRHLVFTNVDLSARKLAEIAVKSGLFKDGVNIERVTPDVGGATISVYERGSGYTRSCGSGAIASAYALSLQNGKNKFEITTDGGILSVELRDDGALLTGEVKEVFKGEIDYAL